MATEPHIVSGHETRDANIHNILVALAALAVVAVLSVAMVYGIFWYLADHPLRTAPPNPLAGGEQQQIPPPPRIQDHPAVELHDLLSAEDAILGTYGWTNKQQGIVRIPIDRAMELQLQQGFPTKPKGK